MENITIQSDSTIIQIKTQKSDFIVTIQLYTEEYVDLIFTDVIEFSFNYRWGLSEEVEGITITDTSKEVIKKLQEDEENTNVKTYAFIGRYNDVVAKITARDLVMEKQC